MCFSCTPRLGLLYSAHILPALDPLLDMGPYYTYYASFWLETPLPCMKLSTSDLALVRPLLLTCMSAAAFAVVVSTWVYLQLAPLIIAQHDRSSAKW